MTSFYEELRTNKSVSDEKENEQSRKSIDKWIFRLFLLLIGFMPLIVLADVEEVVSPLISNIDMLSSGVKGDLFTHYKALLIVTITVIIGVLFLAKVLFLEGTIRKTFLNYVLSLFVVAIVVSTIMSPNVTIALNGQYNRSDGAISWVCYIVLLFIAINIEYPKNIVGKILYAMMPFVYLNLCIITMNFYGQDLMQYSWVQTLVSITLPSGASISEDSQLVGTLNQWNYMSGMFAMLTIMYLVWAIISKFWFETIIGAITAVVTMAVMLMSISTSGFLTLVCLAPFMIVAFLKAETKRNAWATVVVFIVLTIPIFNELAEKDSRVWEDSFGFFIKNNPYIDDVVSMIFKENTAYASDNVIELPVVPESGWAFGSGRGYIWDETLDLIGNRAFLGYGSDSLVYNFPHFNIDARAGLYSENTITDKPHNNYLGVLYGFGVLGFVAFIMLVAVTGLCLIKSLVTKLWAPFILLCFSAAYFVQSIFNDSLPGVTAVVFVILGLALNIYFTQNKEIQLHERND